MTGGSLEAVDALLQAAPDPAPTQICQSPVNLSLQAGADPGVADDSKKTALTYASNGRWASLVGCVYGALSMRCRMVEIESVLTKAKLADAAGQPRVPVPEAHARQPLLLALTVCYESLRPHCQQLPSQ